jgi:hypothetical protein
MIDRLNGEDNSAVGIALRRPGVNLDIDFRACHASKDI